MREINKRIFTSIILISILYLSIINNIILFFTLIFIYYQIIFELFRLLKKIFIKKKKKIYFILIVSLIYIFLILIKIFNIHLFNINDQLIVFYLIVVICVFTDIGGFVFGKIIKGKKLSKISPSKTYAGSIGSYVSSFLFSYFLFIEYYSLEDIIFFTFSISTVSQLGDLFISHLKRKAKVKDTGDLLPGHGGILDRFDGIMFAIPTGYLISIYI
tara:strand:+ start:5654 stop:6298 length:645 start_codon:yes stop_codon:yes gene_type:complete